MLQDESGVSPDLEGGFHDSVSLDDLVEESFYLDPDPGAHEHHVRKQDPVFKADAHRPRRPLLNRLLHDSPDARHRLHSTPDELLSLQRRVEQLRDIRSVLEDLKRRAYRVITGYVNKLIAWYVNKLIA